MKKFSDSRFQNVNHHGFVNAVAIYPIAHFYCHNLAEESSSDRPETSSSKGVEETIDCATHYDAFLQDSALMQET